MYSIGRAALSWWCVGGTPLAWRSERMSARAPTSLRWSALGAKVGRLHCTAPKPSSLSPAGGDGDVSGETCRNFSALQKPLVSTLECASENGSDLRVAYQGCRGSFSEAAVLKAYPQCEPVPCEHFENAFKAVELSRADKAVLPIENSSDGCFYRNLDLLMSHKLHIVGEVHLIVDHCLMALPGLKKEDLKRVLGHPQALRECNNALSKLDVARESFIDGASAAQFIASEGIKDTGVVASARAADLYGLEILEHGLQDVPTNITRFLILAREPIIPIADRPFKTSITFALKEGSWVLFKALAVFSFRNIEIIKIENRPLRMHSLRVVNDLDKDAIKNFDYLFYVDIQGSMAQRSMQNAFTILQEYVTSLRILGSFPADATL